MRALWLWGLLLLLSVSGAQGLNAERDPRLNQRVSLRVPATPLRQLLRQLERQSGVELRVEARFGEYRAFARLQNRPLHETLSLLAETFGFAWRAEPTDKGENAPLRYVLYQPEAERRREEGYQRLLTDDILALTRDALRLIPPELLTLDYETLVGRLGLRLRLITHTAVLAEGAFKPQTPLPVPDAPGVRGEALAAARDALLVNATHTPYDYLTLQALYRLTDLEWRNLRTRGCLRVSVDRVPAAWREQWLRDYIRLSGYTEEEIAAYQKPSDDPDGVPIIDFAGSLKALRDGALHIDLLYDPISQQLKAMLSVESPEMSFKAGIIRLDGETLLQRIFGVDEFAAPDAPEWLDKTTNKPIQLIQDAAWKQSLQRNWAEWLSYRLVEGLETVGAEGVGEFYPFGVNPYRVEKQEWRTLLRSLLPYYQIESRGGALLFQARARFLERARNIPQSSLSAWTATPLPTLDALALMATRLSRNQIGDLARLRGMYLSLYEGANAELYGYEAWQSVLQSIEIWERLYYALRWYAALNPTQRAALQSGARLPYEAMTPPQRSLLAEALWRNEFSCFEASPALLENAYAQLTVEEDESEVHLPLENRVVKLPQRSYTLRFYTADKTCQVAQIWYYLPKAK